MEGSSWEVTWDVLKWIVTCLIMVAPLIQNAISSRGSNRGERVRTASGLAVPRNFSMTDRPLIERTKQLLSELEGHILPVLRCHELLTAVSVAQILETELVARIASKERALVECGLLNEPAGVSYYLERLLMTPLSLARHKTAEELSFDAMRQAYAARDLLEATQRLRQVIGPVS